MAPTVNPELKNGFAELVVLDKVTPVSKIVVGDVVIAWSKGDRNSSICKRVVAKAGDTIVDKNRVLTIPRGHVWLQGDNASNSVDSRTYGPVPLGLVMGRVMCSLYPRPRFIPNSLDFQPDGYQPL